MNGKLIFKFVSLNLWDAIAVGWILNPKRGKRRTSNPCRITVLDHAIADGVYKIRFMLSIIYGRDR
jgi:hypothetical protein